MASQINIEFIYKYDESERDKIMSDYVSLMRINPMISKRRNQYNDEFSYRNLVTPSNLEILGVDTLLSLSDYQKDMVTSLADRAEAVRNRMVQPNEDNMLKITNDGRKLALDQRLINDMLPDNDCSKASSCVDKAYKIWDKTKEKDVNQASHPAALGSILGVSEYFLRNFFPRKI